MPLPDGLARYDMRAVVHQLPDGQTYGPEIHLGAYLYTPTEARQIAEALLAVAAVAEEMMR
jgi:hypothetical protein